MSANEPTPGRSRPGRPKGWRKGVMKYSKMYQRRVADSRTLVAAIEVYKAQAAEGLQVRLAPEVMEGEAPPDFGLQLDLLGRSVTSALERLRTAERQCLDRELATTIVRRKSEKLAREVVYPRAVLVRRLIDTELGKESGRQVHGMVGKTLRKPRRLHGQIQHLMWMLDEGGEEPSDPLFDSLAVEEREAWLRKIKPGYEQLTELLDELTELEVREQSARDEKNIETDNFDATYGEARRLVEASFAFAGIGGKLTRMLRSYVHRRLLVREARRKQEARADGRVQHVLRSAAASVKGWIGGRPRTVA